MTGYADNIILWGWRHLGKTAVGVKVHMSEATVANTKTNKAMAVNANYPPLGLEHATTFDRGLALLSKIAGA